MHEIAGKHCPYASRFQADGYVPRGVARRRFQPHFAIEFIIHIDNASNVTVGTMAGLSQIGRGTFSDGKPTTEIVASADFDSVEFERVYDPNSSLKVSMGLPPIETARGRIDLIMDVANGKVGSKSDPAKEFFYKAYTISYWTMPKQEAAQWLDAQFGS